MPTHGNLTMVQNQNNSPLPPADPLSDQRRGFQPASGMRGAVSSSRPQSTMVVVCWDNAQEHSFSQSIRASIQLKTERCSSPLELDRGRCVSRSCTGVHCGAFGCKDSQAQHRLGQKTLQGSGIPALCQINSSHLGIAATGVITTKPR